MKHNQLARESFWGSIITYLGVCLGLLTTFFIQTAYLTTEEVGLMRILVEVATLLSGLGMLGMTTSINRYFPYFQKVTPEGEVQHTVPNRGFFFWIIAIATVGLALVLPAYLLWADQLNQFLGKESLLLDKYKLFVLPLTIFITLWTCFELYSIQLMRLAIPRTIRELVLRLLLLICYITYALEWVDFAGFVFLFVGCYGLCMLCSLGYLSQVTVVSLQREPGFPSADIKRSFVRYSLLTVISVVGTTLAGRVDLLMLGTNSSAGLKAAGVYSIGFFMVSIIEIPTRAIINLATARIASLMKEQRRGEVRALYKQVSHYQLLSSMIIYLTILVSVEHIIGLMPKSEAYAGSAPVFAILGFSKLIEVCFTACHPIINNSRYYHWSLVYTFWIIAVAVVANAYLIPLWGTVGAATATLISTVAGYLLLQVVVTARLGLTPFSWRLARTVLLGGILVVISSYLPSFSSHLVSIMVRSGVIALIGLTGVIILRLAPEAERFIVLGVKKQFCCKSQRH